MANLLTSEFRNNVRAQYRSRALLAGSLALLVCGAFSILALAPAEVALTSFAVPAAPSVPDQSGDLAADSNALAQTRALLAVLAPFDATSSTSSVDAIEDALGDAGQGVTFDAISYSASGGSITLSGNASSPDAANQLRVALQSDPHFSDVSIPVAALIGSQNGAFTISMNVAQ